MARIPLTQGQFALIDDEDIELIAQYRWWAVNSSVGFYAATKIGRRVVHMQRIIMDDPPGKLVDHWNHDTLDNRRQNLRIATYGQNKANGHASSKSGYKGAYWSNAHNCWHAQIRYGGICYSLGYFSTPEDAARAYDSRAREIHGEFAFLNFPES